jgi:hypothetical protein
MSVGQKTEEIHLKYTQEYPSLSALGHGSLSHLHIRTLTHSHIEIYPRIPKVKTETRGRNQEKNLIRNRKTPYPIIRPCGWLNYEYDKDHQKNTLKIPIFTHVSPACEAYQL